MDLFGNDIGHFINNNHIINIINSIVVEEKYFEDLFKCSPTDNTNSRY